MTDKELRKLGRVALLEMLVDMGKKNEALEKENESLKKLQEDKRIQIQNAGSIANAALELNKVFESVQAAADQYLLNVKQLQENEEKQVMEQANTILEEAQSKAQSLVEQAEVQAEQILSSAKLKAKDIIEQSKEQIEQKSGKLETNEKVQVG